MSAYDVASAADDAALLLRRGESLNVVWRHAILQLLDVIRKTARGGRPPRLRRRGRQEMCCGGDASDSVIVRTQPAGESMGTWW
jgi:hypothetical protein